ncbi:TetR/AcrR family transcriptional regulator [Pseudobutyrivibrio xylanivorans]|uniref:Transcriptional regulator, TetR family n=1 Tax=Pseudobutyrivibrio xylanivorans DSM 14809 TaxID=1123012 RepID=A0A1M6KK17_PSEXY|nr:TetR/AcrR family transcriptional regulator [Pseudobutyrivibrio xylanivorans]SHJ59276.1 transcriptional regulator, TetR family [Pseudobutyrivibrio xylanivorans DSM 14809]
MAVENKETIDKRREEIMDACEKLYETMGFQGINIKVISTETSFSRPSIYNYFQTKEEIFLGLLTREYMKWNEDLKNIIGRNSDMDKDSLAEALATSMEERKTLLKISAMNLYEIEENSRAELLVEYKKVFKDSVELFDECLKKHLGVSEEKSTQIRYAFFPYMYGIYPYSYPTDKQISAMDEVKLSHMDTTIYEMTYQFLTLIL